MGRKSSLTPDQWAQIERRHLLNGESINALAKEFGVDESTVRKKINPNKSDQRKNGKPLRDMASAKVEAEKTIQDISAEVAKLPVIRQQTFNDLSCRLRSISGHLAGAAEYGAATAHRLSGIAHSKVQEIDDAAPLNEQSFEALRGVAVLTKMANESSTIGLNLLAANKEMIKRGMDDEPVQPVKIVVQVEDASVPES